ncbi:Aldo-keto reductase yakc [Endocarpon pusillum Z07020]|uniref:Aldo-keto reductase yakc n=1 Tax=Endocarpon pusillum (strain Z07020 / HMAS-L-300199) TaxID=1263415 RepID=U1GVN9_ENDPU|nr:Aldo-keto reductase yakc [Endocarpon pusillum Z07020]ERF76121.1 Aldo-keto reductase yakc [Endocarpon pusillum Z07020]
MSSAPALPTRQLGRDGPQVTALGIGLMGLSAFYGSTESDEERLKFLDYVYASGQRFWDTADMYGDNEDLVGKWFQTRGKRDEIFLATKFANYTHPDGTRTVRNEPSYIREACDLSLSRLGTDHIDLYYCHRVDPKQPIEITVETMVELKKAGKIQHLGLSEVSAETLRRACKVHHIAAVQIEYSPFTMDIEDPKIGLLDACRDLGVATVAYSPLGRGFLTGRYRSPDDFEEGDFRRFAPRFSPENFPKNLELVDAIAQLAEKKGCTSGQLVLAFLMAQGADIIPIPGTTKYKNYDENMASLKIEVSDEEDREIRKAIENATVLGGRYPPGFAAMLFADSAPLEEGKGKSGNL